MEEARNVRDGTRRGACHFQSIAFRGQRFSTWRTIIYHGPWPSSVCVCGHDVSRNSNNSTDTHSNIQIRTHTPTHSHTHTQTHVSRSVRRTPRKVGNKNCLLFFRFFVNLAQLKNVDAAFCVIVNRLFCMHAELYIINYSMSVHIFICICIWIHNSCWLLSHCRKMGHTFRCQFAVFFFFFIRLICIIIVNNSRRQCTFFYWPTFFDCVSDLLYYFFPPFNVPSAVDATFQYFIFVQFVVWISHHLANKIHFLCVWVCLYLWIVTGIAIYRK